MRKIIALSLGALVVLASASCRRESTTPEEARELLKAPVTITASMDGYQVKATDVSFEDGDAIGVFALKGLDAADTASDGNAQSARVYVLAHFQSAVSHSL